MCPTFWFRCSAYVITITGFIYTDGQWCELISATVENKCLCHFGAKIYILYIQWVYNVCISFHLFIISWLWNLILSFQEILCFLTQKLGGWPGLPVVCELLWHWTRIITLQIVIYRMQISFFQLKAYLLILSCFLQ